MSVCQELLSLIESDELKHLKRAHKIAYNNLQKAIKDANRYNTNNKIMSSGERISKEKHRQAREEYLAITQKLNSLQHNS